MSDNEIIEEFLNHIIKFVEKPQLQFSNLPVCPYAKRARLQNRIRFEVIEMTKDGIINLIPSFAENKELEVMVCIHPRKDLPCSRVYEVAEELNKELTDFQAFCGHPEDPFNIKGLYTRREPYPNVQIINKELGNKATAGLRKTGYYKMWREEHFRYTDIIPLQEPPVPPLPLQ